MFDFDPSKIWDAAGLFVAGAAGALVSLPFSEHLDTFAKRISAVASGAACAHYVTPLVAAHLEIAQSREGGVAFLLGLFGMSIAASVIRSIKNADMWEFLKNRFGGGDKE